MPELTFLLDVDNTLLDNDRLKAGLDEAIRTLIGSDATQAFWATYDSVRRDEEYVDFPATLAAFARGRPDLPNQRLSELVMTVPFASYVYPGAFETIEYLGTIGLPVIVSDGDPVYQRMKIEQSGLAAAVDGRVVLTVHKQDELDAVFRDFPAGHYAVIDDKTTILADIGRRYPERVTTVLVCQGKYARLHAAPRPDMVVPHIGDISLVPRQDFFATGPGSAAVDV